MHHEPVAPTLYGLLAEFEDPQALTEAYGEVIVRFPGERRLVAEAARRIVDQLDAWGYLRQSSTAADPAS